MKEVIVLSGKGGTGKTSIVGSLAALAERKVLADCDVDAADLHLLLNPSVKQENEFWSGQLACIDSDKCIECGICQKLCRFNAIKDFKIEEISCEGCGFCSHICPVEAITMKERLAGHLFVSETRYGALVHARLGIAQENSGKLVTQVRQQAKQIAEKQGLDYIISDGPPGIGCPVISSLSGISLALLVTEPTLSGMHDLERVIGVCRHFGVPATVCINKHDINDNNTQQIESYCSAQGITVTAKIPFDNVVTEALVHGVPVVEYSDGRVSQEMKTLWDSICEILKDKVKG
ncbi:MAG: ATP-binding protein [Dehalococcoidales bacterium]|nr:ATP-binding protein [Dehalococcoidales bacterium]